MSKTKSTLISKELKDKLKNFDNLQKDVKKAGKAITTDVLATLKDLIQGSTYIDAIRWHQYIPGFNDGDACEFTIGDLEVQFSDEFNEEYGNQEKKTAKPTDDAVDEEPEEEDEDDDGDGKFVSDYEIEELIKEKMDVLNHKEIAKLEKQYKAISKLYGELTAIEGELRQRFGDNVEIVVTKKGVETNDYDCGY